MGVHRRSPYRWTDFEAHSIWGGSTGGLHRARSSVTVEVHPSGQGLTPPPARLGGSGASGGRGAWAWGQGRVQTPSVSGSARHPPASRQAATSRDAIRSFATGSEESIAAELQ